ncbi:WXG100 family type VII secretion target [Streptomyces griseorubiginosus]|uniref:ESAT-6-like protein n=1 Tax=Streptomyces griseorubiginosus TaxID=67304 RepID=A0A101RPV7_9ACTN|nr:hypothetical protein [Streptomyces griseorubiginosus]KUN59318.1 hypothetical protein AQJ54_40425 [Streptomyces griseorubiginosus]
MTTYQVSLEQMQYVEGEMQAINNRLSQTLANLNDEVHRNLQHWLNSDPRQLYNTRQKEWTELVAAMQNLLNRAQVAVGNIGEHYAAGEKYGVSLWEQ